MTKYSVVEVRKQDHRVYYRVFADGVELPGLVFIYASEKSEAGEKLLLRWCSANVHRLETGAIVQADLARVAGTGE